MPLDSARRVAPLPVRRRRIGALVLATTLAVSSGCAPLGRPAPESDPARALHFDAIVVDGHADTTPRFSDPGWDWKPVRVQSPGS